MNNPKSRDDDERSSVANQEQATLTEGRASCLRATTRRTKLGRENAAAGKAGRSLMPTDLDQSKRGLQDDHDPSDIGQKVNDKPKSSLTRRSGQRVRTIL
jgi:hypothetical protein